MLLSIGVTGLTFGPRVLTVKLPDDIVPSMGLMISSEREVCRVGDTLVVVGDIEDIDSSANSSNGPVLSSASARHC